MLEWIVLLVVGVIVYDLRARLTTLEKTATDLRSTIAELRARLTAEANRAAAPPPAPPPTPVARTSSSVPPARPAIPPIVASRPAAPVAPAKPSPPPGPPPPPRPPRPTVAPRAPEPPAPPFDWEKFIGVKLFSWIAGAALALAAIFFLRYSIDHGWLRPEIRMAIGLVVGIALLAVCELKVAREYPQTANAMDAAGIAILFATVFASFALWHLVPPTAAFALLIIVTSVAVLLSIRRDSMFIALLGLIGGFATPVLLSTGQDNPIGLFGYLLLLNAGLAWVAYKKRWPALSALSMVLSTLYQWGWVIKFLNADKLPIAVGVFLLFPIVSVLALALGGISEADDAKNTEESLLFAPSLFANSARISSALPLLFSLYLSAIPAYGAHFGILFGFLFCVSAGLFAMSVTTGPQWLHTLGGGSALLTVAIWFNTSYTSTAWPWLLGIVSVFVLFYLAAPFIASSLRHVELSQMGALAVFAAPALLFSFPVLFAVEPQSTAPALPFGVLFALLAACATFAIFARAAPVHYVAAFFALAGQAVWSAKHLDAAHLYSALTLYGVFGLFYVGAPLVARRFKRPFEPAGAAGVLTLVSLGLLLFIASGQPSASSLWGMALLIAILNVGLYVESAAAKMPALSLAGTVLSWLVLAAWWRSSNASAIVPALIVMAAFALFTMAGSAWARQHVGEGESAKGFDANVFLGLIGHVFVVFVVTRPELSIPPWPVFGALAVLDLAVLTASLYMKNGAVHFGATALTAVILMLWTTTAAVVPWPMVAILAAGVSTALAFVAVALARRVGARDRLFGGALSAAIILSQIVIIVAQAQKGSPDVLFLSGAEVVFVGAALSLSWIDIDALGWVSIAAAAAAAVGSGQWQQLHHRAPDWPWQLALAAPVYLLYVVYPLILGRRVGQSRSPFVATVLATVAFFFLARASIVLGGFESFIGALPVVQGILLVPTLAMLIRLERSTVVKPREAAMASGRLALVAAATLACVTVAIPLQLEKNWITIGWALEGAALVWLFRRIPHVGLMAAAAALLATAFVRLTLNPAVLTYHPRGAMPILNWYLYTYLLCAVALFVAAKLMPPDGALWRRLAGGFASAATMLLFLLLNIEIADFYANGSTITFNFNANLAQDLTYTIGWALFSVVLLVVGIKIRNRPCRIAAIALLTGTVAKCFLHDLGRLGGLYRVSSFVGLAVCLSLVAIVLQKFVLARDTEQLSQA